MPKKKNIRIALGSTPETIRNGMPDYSNDPCFVKKNKMAREFIKRHGLPEGLRKSN